MNQWTWHIQNYSIWRTEGKNDIRKVSKLRSNLATYLKGKTYKQIISVVSIGRVKGNDKGNVFEEQNKWKYDNINSRRTHINLKTSDARTHDG